MADHWYTSQKGGSAHAVYVGWFSASSRDDNYYTRCGINIGRLERPQTRNGWIPCGLNPDPGVKRCSKCEKAIVKMARQAEEDAVWWRRHAANTHRKKQEIRAKFKKIRDERREETIRKIQGFLAPGQASKKIARKILTVVRQAMEEEARHSRMANAELSKVQ